MRPLAYVGPHVVCKNKKMVRLTPSHGCQWCKLALTGKFCSQCGAELVTFQLKSEGYIEGHDVMEDLNRHLSYQSTTDLKFHVYTPNKKVKGLPPIPSYVSYDVIIRELHESDPVKELAIFHKAFAKELKELRYVYDSDGVHVQWGVVFGFF